MPLLPRWRYLQHWNRASTPSQNVSSLTARVCQIEAHAPCVSCSSGSANSWNLHERSDGSPATGSLAPMAPGLRIRELTHGRIKMMTALCPAWSHTFQTMCLGFQSHQVMPQAFRLPKPSFFLFNKKLPTCRTTTRLIGFEFTGWRLFTDGGFKRNIDGTLLAGWVIAAVWPELCSNS